MIVFVSSVGDFSTNARNDIVSVSLVGDFSAVSRCGQVGWRGRESLRAFGWRGYADGISFPRDCHATAAPSLATTRRYGCTLGIIRLRRARFNGLSFRGNEVTVGISRERKRLPRRLMTFFIYSCAFVLVSSVGDFSTSLEMTTCTNVFLSYIDGYVRRSSSVRSFLMSFRPE